jgi:hypothetical protein
MSLLSASRERGRQEGEQSLILCQLTRYIGGIALALH